MPSRCPGPRRGRGIGTAVYAAEVSSRPDRTRLPAVAVAALALVLASALSGCSLFAGPDAGGPSASPTPTRPPTDPATVTPGGPTTIPPAVSVDGGPLTAVQARVAIRRCEARARPTLDPARVRVELGRAIAYLTDDILTLPVVVFRAGGHRYVCNRDGVVPARTAAPATSTHRPAVVIASTGVTGTYNGFTNRLEPFVPCVVLAVTPAVGTVQMRLDWPTGDSVWYSAAIRDGFAVVSAWQAGSVGNPEQVDLRTVRTQIRAYDVDGHRLAVG